MSADDASVSVQLVLNLECLGFDVQSVVHKRVPLRGLPQRYSTFKLSTEMFDSSNSAAAEVVLFFLFEAMPWDAVADVLPGAPGLSPDQAKVVRGRLVESARHHLAELALCFPCVEVDQLTAFKKQAAALLDLLKHTLPPEIGHARRLVTEAGPRMAWVCLRLSSYILQHQAIGRVDPIAISGAPFTAAHARVLKAQVVRETLRFQQAASEFLEAEAAVTEASKAINADYEASRRKVAALDAAKEGTSSMHPRSSHAGEGTSAVLQRRKQLLAEIESLAAQQEGVEETLGMGARPQFTHESLEQTWRESGGEGLLSDRVGGQGTAVDLAELSRQWVRELEALNATVAQDKKEARSLLNRRSAAAAPPPPGPTKVAELIDACSAQIDPLTALLNRLRAHNTDIETELRPRLESELAALQQQLLQSPLDALLAQHGREGSRSPAPLPLHSCPVPTSSRETLNPDTWLYDPQP